MRAPGQRRIFYVDANGSDETGTGSMRQPFASWAPLLNHNYGDAVEVRQARTGRLVCVI